MKEKSVFVSSTSQFYILYFANGNQWKIPTNCKRMNYLHLITNDSDEPKPSS